MDGYIESIKSQVPNSNGVVEIDVRGRNVIITGVNGCGKTRLIELLFDRLRRRVADRENYSERVVLEEIARYESVMNSTPRADSYHSTYENMLKVSRSNLEFVRNPGCYVNDIEDFVVEYQEHRAVLLKFEAGRKADIRGSRAAVSRQDLERQVNDLESTAQLFEEYLVSYKTAQAYAESPNIGNDPEGAKRISDWFDKLECDFQELFEDPTLLFRFEPQAQTFFIIQNGKSPYRLQNLSSGFSSVLAIYADLLTKVELRHVSPEAVRGVVFVDEIDAHLHVSLQRKILSFLTKSFPKVQFIVTTHSPFVVASVSDAVIYDLSSLQQVDDLSLYSYESILDGLFNVLPISEILKGKVVELSELMSSADYDLAKMKDLVFEIAEHESKLDSESAYFLKRAKIIINKSKGAEA